MHSGPRWGYALSDNWLLTGTVGLEFLDSEITDSPIVDRDQIMSGNVGLAYNVNVFRPRYYDGSAPRSPKFEIRIGAFQDQVSTKVKKDTVNGVPGSEIDLEDVLGSADEETVLQFGRTSYGLVIIIAWKWVISSWAEALKPFWIRTLSSVTRFYPAETLVATQNDMTDLALLVMHTR